MLIWAAHIRDARLLFLFPSQRVVPTLCARREERSLLEPDRYLESTRRDTGAPREVQPVCRVDARRIPTNASYWLVDAYVSFSGEALSELLRSTEFSIVANNLFDKAYLSAITENAAWLGAPRTISMTATVSF